MGKTAEKYDPSDRKAVISLHKPFNVDVGARMEYDTWNESAMWQIVGVDGGFLIGL